MINHTSIVGPKRIWRSLGTLLALSAGIILIIAVSFLWIKRNKPVLLPGPVISSCKELAPGMKRIGAPNGLLQFDFVPDRFIVIKGMQDTPPFTYGFQLKPKNRTPSLSISFGPTGSISSRNTFLALSRHSEKHMIFDDRGNSLGEDYWGYLDNKNIWRETRFYKGAAVVTYGLADKKDAELFDQVISTACVLPSSNP